MQNSINKSTTHNIVHRHWWTTLTRTKGLSDHMHTKLYQSILLTKAILHLLPVTSKRNAFCFSSFTTAQWAPHGWWGFEHKTFLQIHIQIMVNRHRQFKLKQSYTDIVSSNCSYTLPIQTTVIIQSTTTFHLQFMFKEMHINFLTMMTTENSDWRHK